ncbi:hypothetical protein KIW84_050168, partial [Lathyrus oleraceus]
TPEEAWSGLKPNVSHFKTFGCIGYVHIPEARRTKLDNKSCKAIFLGVSEESKAYRIYNPNSKKKIISRDVVFEENGAWDWGRNDDHVTTTSNVLTWENDGEDIEGHEEDSFPEAVDTTHEQGHEEQESSSSNSSTARGCRTRREVR